ncbi:MAG: alpha/beta hydrolase, partial [Chloroflexota bacterium]
MKRIENIDQGVVQYKFDVFVAGEVVPCILWTPTPPTASQALIAMGHGGSQHKQCESIRTRAIRYATTFAWATLAIDAPQHGERISPEEAAIARSKTLARVSGDPNALALSVAEKIKYLDEMAAQAVPEWQVALDTVFYRDILPRNIPLAYWGVSQGSSIGIPLLAVDHRFTCAVFGLAHLHPDHTCLRLAAEQITVPLRFAFQWDDPIRERDYGLALFEAFGSKEKSM